jgi:chorismate dehydratase
MTEPRFVVASVSFLNAQPLVEGLENQPGVSLISRVPSELLKTLTDGLAHVALCPIIDFQRAEEKLCLLPVGGIASDGPTLTVRVFSQVPLDRLETVHVDGDSHTSVALLQVICAEAYGLRPVLEPLTPGRKATNGDTPQSLLLIGDKVVRDEPSREVYPHQLDLGRAWKELTGLPFVFAVWMARAGEELGRLPEILDRQRSTNAERIGEIGERSAGAAGWPPTLAARYLGEILRYSVGEMELRSIELFWSKCRDLGLIDQRRPLELYSSHC